MSPVHMSLGHRFTILAYCCLTCAISVSAKRGQSILFVLLLLFTIKYLAKFFHARVCVYIAELKYYSILRAVAIPTKTKKNSLSGSGCSGRFLPGFFSYINSVHYSLERRKTKLIKPFPIYLSCCKLSTAK